MPFNHRYLGGVAFSLAILFSPVNATDYVQARMWGRLGNNLFIIAAATSLALDNNAEAVFPDFALAFAPNNNLKDNYQAAELRLNYQKMFSHLDVSNPSSKPAVIYVEPSFNYSPIPYHPNMLLEGWFQSEKYFSRHKDEIIELFGPSWEIKQYLEDHYRDIINDPNTVSVHLRAYNKENLALEKVFPTYGREYFEKAMNTFPEDSWFIIFSDQIEWAKQELEVIPRKMTFIEAEPYYHDFYLMSMCKHHIISNSSFSWWAAYLNKDPGKKVIVPPVWFCPEYNHNADDLIPQDWIILK